MKHRLLSYYGSKVRLAPKYPIPKHKTIIEPFAGSAGYSLLYHDRNVVLIEKNPKVYGALKFLHGSTPDDIRSLPLLSPGQEIKTLDIPQEAQWLIGFWVNNAVVTPMQSLSSWARSKHDALEFWGKRCRERLARTVEKIKHWTILYGDYTLAPDIEATWFVDPPYQIMGKYYPVNNIDYSSLAQWCRDRKGQVVVCENDGATWLPFWPLCDVAGASKHNNGRKKSTETIWVNHCDPPVQYEQLELWNA